MFSSANGLETEANGTASVSNGFANKSDGEYSSTNGWRNQSSSVGESVVGTFSTILESSGWAQLPTDRIFNIGVGTSGENRKDGLSILKNGLATLPSITNDLISAEPTGKAVVTKEYLATVNGNYVDDVAASGGVSVGQMYHTAGVVKIRLS